MRRILTIPFAAAICFAAPQAQTSRPRTSRPQESLSAWLHFKEIQIPSNHAGLLDFVLDREVLGAARIDHADIRLYDATGKEIPYVLRVRRDVDIVNAYTAREFNRSAEGGVSQVSYDLGEQPRQHNEVEIETAGTNFRRLAEVQGSSDGSQWSTLVSQVILFRFTAAGNTVEQRAVPYPVSRYRYLRIRVERDAQTDLGAPQIKTVQIRQSVRMKGELASFRGELESRDPDRVNGRPASIWRVNFGAYIPIERLVLAIGDEAFSRPFHVEAIDDPANPDPLASGELARREAGDARQATIEFPEHFAHRLKLTVTDDRNAALSISEITAMSPARQVVFTMEGAGAGPVRVYYGNPKALAPRYDLAARLPADPRPAPLRLALGPQRDNPVYSPEPRPLSERLPWLVYLVLGAATVILAVILLGLVRRSAREPSAQSL